MNDHEEQVGGGGGCCSSGNGTHGGMMHGYFKRKLGVGFLLLAVSGSLLLLAMFFSTLKAYDYIGRDINSQTTIAVSGDGEAYGVPNVASVSFTITHEAKTATEARQMVDTAMKKIHDFLTKAKIEEKYIKTTSYDLSPKYEWHEKKILCVGYPCYPSGEQVLTGYTVTQSVEVKIHDLDAAGTILGGLTDNGASNVSGLNFMVENPDSLQAKAREEAIAKAQAKAEQLAKDLNVKLVRIVSFNEGANYPIYYARGGMEMKAMSADAAMPPVPNIPVGENKYTSNVTIVYEIR